jgi:hypothetical protein
MFAAMTMAEEGVCRPLSGHTLDELEPLHVEVGYGSLGRRGALGYDGENVRVGGHTYASALSTHPPARVRFAVPKGCQRFHCHVAINDDVSERGSHATFAVIANSRVVAEAIDVHAGSPAVPLTADLGHASTVELVVTTSAWAYCHAVWLDPTFDDAPMNGQSSVITDPLQRADITVPTGITSAKKCIATAGSHGFAAWVDDLLLSVRAFGRCPDAQLVVFSLDGSPALDEVAANHDAVVVRCRARRVLDCTSKSVLYSVGSLIPAERFVCLDADMLVFDDLGPLFAALDACTSQSILVANEGNDHGIPNLREALDLAYGGGSDPPFFQRRSALADYPLIVNDGLMAGTRTAFLSLERHVRELTDAVRWVDERADLRWRNQFAFNVALATMGSAVEVDPTWNVQLHVQDIDSADGRPRWRGQDVRILHFSGVGKHKLNGIRDHTRVAAAERIAVSEHARPECPPDWNVFAARPWRSVKVPAAALSVPTMLSVRERQTLYWLTREYVRGEGRIIDGGAFLGGSTAALAAGLADRPDADKTKWRNAIASYDRFRVEDYTLGTFSSFMTKPQLDASFRPDFDANIAPWSHYVDVYEGDICTHGWAGEPIELLFLDVVKTWQVNDFVLAHFLPCLIPGRSIIVQQDYLWGFCPWIHMTMELLDRCVRQLDAMENGSVVYLLTDPPSQDVIGARLRDLANDTKRALMDRAVQRWDGKQQGLIKLARAMLVFELDGREAAVAELRRVRERYAGFEQVEECAAVVAGYLGL